jgi:hypothetical protein
VQKIAKARDITDIEFNQITSQIELSSPQLLDVNGPLMKSAIKNMQTV